MWPSLARDVIHFAHNQDLARALVDFLDTDWLGGAGVNLA
jgi:hypothetical protein